MNPVFPLSNYLALCHKLLRGKRTEGRNNETSGYLYSILKFSNDVSIYKDIHRSISTYVAKARTGYIVTRLICSDLVLFIHPCVWFVMNKSKPFSIFFSSIWNELKSERSWSWDYNWTVHCSRFLLNLIIANWLVIWGTLWGWYYLMPDARSKK